jgi:hypothetical protein
VNTKTAPPDASTFPDAAAAERRYVGKRKLATYITLFSATLTELEERFPNVAAPLSIARVVQRTNPFTKLPVWVEVFEPEFGPPRQQQSLFAEGGPAAVKPLFPQDDDYGRYLRSVVPARLRSLLMATKHELTPPPQDPRARELWLQHAAGFRPTHALSAPMADGC